MNEELSRKLGQAKAANRRATREQENRFAEPSDTEVRKTLARRGIVFDVNGERITDPVALKAAIKNILNEKG